MSDERTPLISKSRTGGSLQFSPTWKQGNLRHFHRTLKVYVLLATFFLLLGSYVTWLTTRMPTPLSDVEAAQTEGFAGIHAYNEYLTQFYAPHPANSRENARIKNWLSSLVTEFQVEAQKKSVVMDIVTDDPTKVDIRQDWFTKGEHWVVDSRNVLARIQGVDPELKHQSILINAHYDSVPTSNGVTDNGMGVCITAELIRYFIDHPPKHTIVFLFNNMEEGGLIGAYIFAKHPWFESIKTFINLEGAGAGGRSILVRSNTLFSVKQLATSNAHYQHASPLGNDMMKSKLMKSDTDYTAFDKAGVPGMDIAFYSPRSHYHTQRDSIAYTTPSAMQYMGQMALNALRGLDNGDSLAEDMYEPVVYYDFLGRYLVVLTFSEYQCIQILILIAVPLVAIIMSLKKEKEREGDYFAALKQLVCEFSQALLMTFTAFVSALVSVGIAGFILCLANPMATYGGIYLIATYLLVAGFTGLVGALVLCDKRSWYKQQFEQNTDILLHGLNGIWWLLVLFATWLGSKEISSLYFAIYFLVCGSLASLTLTTLPRDNKYRYLAAFVLQWPVPFIFIHQLSSLTMTSLRHITVDGTPEIAVYVLLGLILVLGLLPVLFWIQLAGNHRLVLKVSSILLLLLLVACLFISPFNTGLSPNKIVFRQEYNATGPTALVTLRSARIEDTLRSVLTKDELETFECHSYREQPTLQECTYATSLVPLYGKLGLGNEASVTVNKVCNDKICTVNGTYSSRNSLFCRVSFEENADTILEAWINNGPKITVKDEPQPFSSLMGYTNEYNTVVPWGVTWPASSIAPRGTFGCFYDEWTRGELPAFVSLRDRLPADHILLIRGQGIAFTKFKVLEF